MEDQENVPRPDDFDPDPTFPDGHAKEGQRRCQGWSKRSGRQCLNNPVRGRDYCRMHGGKVPRGKDNGAWKGGAYAQAMSSVDMGERFEELLGDEELITLRREIAIATMRIEKAIGNENWEEARKLLETKRKLVRDEAKRVKDEGHYVPVSGYQQLMQRLIGEIVYALPDEHRSTVIEAVRRVEAGQISNTPRQLTD